MTATLHMLCGKIASGKSTLAAQLAQAPGSVLIAEDAWLSTLFADQMTSGADYLRCAALLRQAMAPHVVAVLGTGATVVLDFPANTPQQRAWMRGIIDAAQVPHQMHVLDVSDATCLDRLRARNVNGAHEFTVTEAQFHQFTRHFTLPHPDEGFTLIRH